MKTLAFAVTMFATLLTTATVVAPAYAQGNYVHYAPEYATGNGSPSWHDGGR